MMSLKAIWILLALTLSGKVNLAQESTCLHTFTIRTLTTSSACELIKSVNYTSMQPSVWDCADLQTTLRTISSLDFSISLSSSISGALSNCVSVVVPPGRHFITGPLHMGNSSVQLTAVLNNTATIYCNYVADSNINYMLYFDHSELFSMNNLILKGCPFPLRLDSVRMVRIRNSVFQNFSEAALDIYNSPNISITGSTFVDNVGTGIVAIPFRGNTGAVAIGFNTIQTDIPHPHFNVSHCNFTNNRATAENSFRTTNRAFFSRVFTGRGGGLGIFINESLHNITGVISDNVFLNNYARLFGGGLYIVIFGERTQNFMLVERSIFDNNVARSGAGGLLMTFFSTGLLGAPHTTNVTDCSFSGNSGESGGAVLAYLAYEVFGVSFFKLERCNFSSNRGVGSVNDYGSALGVWLVNNIREKASLPQYQIVDCIFDGNVGLNGIVSIGYAPFGFYGRNIFRNNRGTGSLRIIGSLVDINGYMEFTGNSANTTTSFEMLSFGQMRFHSNLLMNFTGNTGRFGASISSSGTKSAFSFQNLAFNPQCFILHENPMLPPSEWNNISVTFRKNVAVLASSLYLSTLASCTWFSQDYPFFNRSYILDWPLWDFGNDSKNTGYADPYAVKYHVETAAQVIQTAKKQVSAWPGLKFNVSLTGWDEFRNPTTVSARFLFTGSQDNKDVTVVFHPEAVVVDSGGENGTLSAHFPVVYSVSSAEALLSSGPIGTVDISAVFENIEIVGDTFALYANLCPGGYELSSSPLQCRCKEQVVEVLSCEPDQDSIIIQRGHWVSTFPSNSSHRHVMTFYTCPAGYCRCMQNSSFGEENCVFMYINTNPDAQCACRRHGLLCGECEEGYGVSALLDRCVSCHDANGLLILLLIIVDGVVLVVLVLIDRKLPAALYSFTFYIQVVPHISLYFPETFEVVGQYLYYLGSVLGFYFPYDFCLFERLNPLVSYFIRFIPLLLAVVIMPATILLRQLKWKRKLKYRGLWLVVLLLYSHAVHTSMSILRCPLITDKTGEAKPRWFVSGNTVCFTGGHVPLALLAIAVLVVCVALVPLAGIVALHNNLPQRLRWLLRDVHLPLTENFREGFKWWSAIELSRRFIFILFITIFPREQVVILLILCIILITYGYIQPYKSRKSNVLELIVDLNFLFLLLLVSSQILEPYYRLPPVTNRRASDTCGNTGRGIAQVTWFLMPFYYFPVVLLVGVCTAYFILLCRTKYLSRKHEIGDKDDEEEPSFNYVSPDVTTQVIELSMLSESRPAVNQTLKKKKKSSKLKRNKSLFSSNSLTSNSFL